MDIVNFTGSCHVFSSPVGVRFGISCSAVSRGQRKYLLNNVENDKVHYQGDFKRNSSNVVGIEVRILF